MENNNTFIENNIHSIDDESLNFEKDLDAKLNAFDINNIKKERKFLSIFALDFEIGHIDLKIIILENENSDL